MISPLRIVCVRLPDRGSRERSFALVRQYQLASAKTAEIAKQLGIQIPELVC